MHTLVFDMDAMTEAAAVDALALLPRLCGLECYYCPDSYAEWRPPFSALTALEVLDFIMRCDARERPNAAAVLADAAQAPRLHSVSITFEFSNALCTLSSLKRLARDPAPLRHLVVGQGIKLPATDVSALTTLRTLCSLELHGPSLAGAATKPPSLRLPPRARASQPKSPLLKSTRASSLLTKSGRGDLEVSERAHLQRACTLTYPLFV